MNAERHDDSMDNNGGMERGKWRLGSSNHYYNKMETWQGIQEADVNEQKIPW